VQFNVLNILASSPTDPTQREISDILVVDRSNITGLLDRMESAGWVKREDVPGDRRAYRVKLTPSGRRLWNRVYPEYERAAKAVAGPLGVERVRATISGLAALAQQATENGVGAGDE
jgi:DNA-binding MarR family transcriptional regulator